MDTRETLLCKYLFYQNLIGGLLALEPNSHCLISTSPRRDQVQAEDQGEEKKKRAGNTVYCLYHDQYMSGHGSPTVGHVGKPHLNSDYPQDCLDETHDHRRTRQNTNHSTYRSPDQSAQLNSTQPRHPDGEASSLLYARTTLQAAHRKPTLPSVKFVDPLLYDDLE